MIHDAGPATGRLDRLRNRFPDADAVVFGHSHIPLHEEAGGFQIFNPGSPTDRRRQPRHTMGIARIARSEEHTSELQSRQYLVCRLLLAKKKSHTNVHLVKISLLYY